MPDKLAEEILWNELCVDLIGHYFIRRNRKGENLNLKSITIINPVTGWSEIAQYDDKGVISIANSV